MPRGGDMSRMGDKRAPGFQKGHVSTRKSAKAAEAIRLARKYCPEAVMYAVSVMKDEGEGTQLRLKAAEILLNHGMPKGESAARYLSEETIGAITLNLVMPTVPKTIDGTYEVPKLGIDTQVQGTGD